jgi:AraC-like DNA-binding protein
MSHPKTYLYRRIVQAKLFIDNHYSEAIDLNILSSEAIFSKFHFLRLFKECYGVTPYVYLKKIRIEKAKELLSQDLPVEEVCFHIGFDSVTSFTTLFKRQVGITPAAFRGDRIARQRLMTSTPLKFIPNCYAESNGWIK